MKDYPVNGKVLMVTRAIPVESGGTMIVIRRLLENFEKSEIVALGRRPYAPFVLKNEQLPNYPMVKIPMTYVKGYKVWRLLSILIGIPIGLYIIWRRNIKLIVGVYPDMGSLTLAYFLALLTRKPLIAYFCDLYAENQKDDWHGKWAKWLQPKVFKKAQKIIAVNAGMEQFYKEKYGIEPLCLPTAINGIISEKSELPKLSSPLIIGYSGSVVKDRLDPFQALIQAIGNNSDYEIRIFTPQSEMYLKSENIWANNVIRSFCTSQQELIKQLRKCHVLYLPLTFNTGAGYNSRAQLATCFGIKSYEYFLSERPILSHSPSDYFTSTFFLDNKCGYLLDRIEKENIISFLEELKIRYNQDAPYLVENALRAAKEFNGLTIAKKFTDTINTII